MNQNIAPSTQVSDLVDIRTVTVDKSLPKEERIADLCARSEIPTASAAVILW